MRKTVTIFCVAFLYAFSAFAENAHHLPAEPDWTKNVTRNGNDVLINNIPQIAQKGTFCVPAAMTMILQYYGEKYSQTRIAGFFRSRKGGGGTSYARMCSAFERGSLAQNYTIFRAYYVTWDEIQTLTNAYENYLRLNPKLHIARKKISANWDAPDNMNPDVARLAFREPRKNLATNMGLIIPLCIDSGIPIFWTMWMNLDPNDQSLGGHGRLIVGYRGEGGKIQEIIYRDSWGEKTCFKRMSFVNVVAATTGIYVVVPAKNKSLAAQIKHCLENDFLKEKPRRTKSQVSP